MAALRKDAELAHKTYQCDAAAGRPRGQLHQGFEASHPRRRAGSRSPHGTLDLERGLVVSCNAYFAQLGTYDVGAGCAARYGRRCWASRPHRRTRPAELKKALPQSAYGQGEVVASPFQMARVAATVANGGRHAAGPLDHRTKTTRARHRACGMLPRATRPARWGASCARWSPAGTGRRAGTAAAAIAGKTGTAELADAPSHAWFIGFAPYGGGARKIAFSVLVENGVYGGTAPRRPPRRLSTRQSSWV